jgi:gas vesicle protein
MEDSMSNRRRWIESVSTLALGLGVGAALGLLFAPRSGRDTRDSVIESAKQTLDGAITAGTALSQHAQNSVAQAKGQVKKAIEVGDRAYREAKSSSS